MVSDIVAVETLRACLKVRRRIDVAHSERVQIRHDLARLRKREPPIELQPVSRGGDAWMSCGHSRNFPSFGGKSRLQRSPERFRGEAQALHPMAKSKIDSAGSLDRASLRSG